MDGEFVDRIVDHLSTKIDKVEVGGKFYTDKNLREIKPEDPRRPDILTVHTLNALVVYLDSNVDVLKSESLLIHVWGPNEVQLISKFSDDEFKQRTTYVKAAGPGCPFKFGEAYDHERFILALQTCSKRLPISIRF